MITASQLKPRMAIRLEGQIYKVLEAEFKAGAGQLGGLVKTKLRNVKTGHISEPHIRPADRVEDLELERQTMEFLYRKAENCAFMNPQTFEQVEISCAILGPAEKFLREGMKIPVEFFEGQAVTMDFPAVVESRVTDTAPAVHSQQDNTWKEATLDTGVQIQVPLFVEPGEIVRVEVETGRYLERVRASASGEGERCGTCRWSRRCSFLRKGLVTDRDTSRSLKHDWILGRQRKGSCKKELRAAVQCVEICSLRFPGMLPRESTAPTGTTS